MQGFWNFLVYSRPRFRINPTGRTSGSNERKGSDKRRSEIEERAPGQGQQSNPPDPPTTSSHRSAGEQVNEEGQRDVGAPEIFADQ